ncbi:hypothetical protein HYH02_008867 [Chlamydomonas schloesseri]|uniref:Nuclear nucleic acid-binding protein C1D n=1 Tax=Chlamydomonas schloesseri TaxID=2026947 RepID=A0A836B1T2_9CHLO|nr:hypothetical protein HYH02_008867 [Chlamydomonas schloesseri]|eukprot:KAG2444997.1 hypothetical protein HYH02_008867 [Chlamydomonas schloesseri]
MAAAVAGASTAGAGAAAAALELPEDVQVQLSTFRQLLGDLKAALGAAAGAVPGGGAELAGTVADPLERSRLCLALAKAVNSLHHVYIRAHGRDPFAPATAGGVSVGRQELDRIRQYDKKVSRAIAEAELRGSRPALELDVAAASRFIDAAIPELSTAQRAALKRAGQVANERRGLPERKPKKARAAGAAAGAAGDDKQGKRVEEEQEEQEEAEEEQVQNDEQQQQQQQRQGAAAADAEGSEGGAEAEEEVGPSGLAAAAAAAAGGSQGAEAAGGPGATPGAVRRSTRARSGGAAAAPAAPAAAPTPSKGGKGKGGKGKGAGSGDGGAAAAAEQFLADFAAK